MRNRTNLQLFRLLELDVGLLVAVVLFEDVEELLVLHLQLHLLLRGAVAVADDGDDATEFHPEQSGGINVFEQYPLFLGLIS